MSRGVPDQNCWAFSMMYTIPKTSIGGTGIAVGTGWVSVRCGEGSWPAERASDASRGQALEPSHEVKVQSQCHSATTEAKEHTHVNFHV